MNSTKQKDVNAMMCVYFLYVKNKEAAGIILIIYSCNKKRNELIFTFLFIEAMDNYFLSHAKNTTFD